MVCKYCGKPVILSPSAKERSRKYGESPSFYTSLFPDHANCIIIARSKNARQVFRKRTIQ